jgi:hypothetical protein
MSRDIAFKNYFAPGGREDGARKEGFVNASCYSFGHGCQTAAVTTIDSV